MLKYPSHILKTQIVVVSPSSCGGSIEFKNIAGLGIQDDSVIVAETSTLPYAVRSIEPGKIRVFLKLKGGLFLAALPARKTAEVLGKIKEIYPAMRAARERSPNQLAERQSSYSSRHHSLELTALIERTKGDFYFYEDGVTQAVGRLIEAIDKERISIGKKLGIEVISEPELGCLQGYMTNPTTTRVTRKHRVSRALGPRVTSITGTSTKMWVMVWSFLRSWLNRLALKLRVFHLMINIISLLMNRDYLGESKRTMESLGLSHYTTEGLMTLLT